MTDAPADPLARLAKPPSAANPPLVMGVLNLTPDSFSDGGRHLDPARAAEAAEAMLAAGADILDIGGESTRPGADPVDAETEAARVLPMLKALAAARPDATISIDTRKPAVARAAFAAGARIWNDVSALTYAPDALETAGALCGAATGGWLCLMHAQGDPKTMQRDPRYGDVLGEVAMFLAARRDAAVAAGVADARLILDPGFGFGKTLAHNLALLRGLDRLAALGRPVLAGVSRKGMIGALSGEKIAERRLGGSVAAALFAATKGARILRVHDVAETAQAVRVWCALADGAPAPQKEEASP